MTLQCKHNVTKLTLARLQGTCSTSLPVGLQRYTASLQEHMQRSASPTTASSHPQPLTNGHTPASTDALPLGLPSLSDTRLSTEGEEEVLRDRRGSHALAGVLGWDADAVLQSHASLPGIGTLMPSWRGVARTLAPIFHEVCMLTPCFDSMAASCAGLLRGACWCLCEGVSYSNEQCLRHHPVMSTPTSPARQSAGSYCCTRMSARKALYFTVCVLVRCIYHLPADSTA